MAGFACLVYRVVFELEYPWNWSVIWQYLFRFDEEQNRYVANYLVLGLLTTLKLSLYAGLLATFIALFVVMARIRGGLFWQLLGRSYVELMRNLPPLVIVFLVYFFLADQITPIIGLNELMEDIAPEKEYWLTFFVAEPDYLSSFLSAVFTLALFEAAYIAEILRAGIEGTPKTQWEAACSMGLNKTQTLRLVIMPQAVKQVMPPLGGQFISLIKDSSIVSVISIQELTYQGTQLMASTYLTIEVWFVIAMLYFVLTFPCSMLVRKLEVQK